ncbi:MAG: DUF5131 family protein [Dehalococcoidales bacterium]|nr:DUF5131 family protein [Dehalococcoidales bacterium]
MLSETKIEYLTHLWSFYPGCNHWKDGHCPLPNCWAHGMARRFKTKTLGKECFTPKLLPEKLLDPLKGYNPKKPRRIGVCFTGDLFGNWVDPEQTVCDKSGYADSSLKFIVLDIIKRCPADRFLFLTKCPQNLKKWSPFPDNAWVGASVCNNEMLDVALFYLSNIEAKIKFLSFEPLLEQTSVNPNDFINTVDWLIIGQQTPARKGTTPKIEWIREIVDAADKAGVPVFLKNNLRDLLPVNELFYHFEDTSESGMTSEFLPVLRQDFPKEH